MRSVTCTEANSILSDAWRIRVHVVAEHKSLNRPSGFCVKPNYKKSWLSKSCSAVYEQRKNRNTAESVFADLCCNWLDSLNDFVEAKEM